MSYGAFGAIKNTFADGAVGGSNLRTHDTLLSVGNIMAFPFITDTLDATGNHTIDDGTPVLITQLPDASPNNPYSYDNQNMLHCRTTASAAPRVIASTQAHQIPHTEPVSFGFFIYARTWSGSTPQLMVSGPGSNQANYGIQRQASVGWRFQRSGGSVDTLGDQRNLTPTGRWFHLVMAVAGGRNTGSNAAALYINGAEVWSGTVGACQTVSSTDNFSFTSDSGDSTSPWTGFMCNAFVTDTVVDAATARALSDESFGHASPYAI